MHTSLNLYSTRIWRELLVQWMHGGRIAAISDKSLQIQILFRKYVLWEERRIIEHFLWEFDLLPTTVNALRTPSARGIRTKKEASFWYVNHPFSQGTKVMGMVKLMSAYSKHALVRASGI
jgi:hypothetical protein